MCHTGPKQNYPTSFALYLDQIVTSPLQVTRVETKGGWQLPAFLLGAIIVACLVHLLVVRPMGVIVAHWPTPKSPA